jgi:Mlc titration factor MtfA (ptsG expression regulator)
MRNGDANGCPPLPAGFAGTRSSREARAAWSGVLQRAYDGFREKTIMAERFGAEPPWLDAYGATSISEFFAVACEAYFVNRPASPGTSRNCWRTSMNSFFLKRPEALLDIAL